MLAKAIPDVLIVVGAVMVVFGVYYLLGPYGVLILGGAGLAVIGWKAS